MYVVVWKHIGFNCRKALSAASYTLVGVVNKLLTVLLNLLLFKDHASFVGIGALCLCIGAGAFYKQAPKRSEAAYVAVNSKVRSY